MKSLHPLAAVLFASAVFPLFAPPPAHAQDITARLWQWRVKRSVSASQPKARRIRLGSAQPRWVAVAQIQPPSGDPASGSPSTTGESRVGLQVPPNRRAVTVYVDGSLGFDGETAVISDPLPREVKLRRRIRVLSLTGEYPLSAKTRLVVGVPYVSQTAELTGNGPTVKQRGSGVGDTSVFVEHRFRESKNGVEPSAGVGVLLPTGSDPYSLSPNELPTGNGFYQPFVRLSVRKLQVPLQLFASVNYGQTLSRNVNGTSVKLPSTYGGEIGFAYAISPEFSASTSLNASRASSPFLLDTGVHVGYLTQALSYNRGENSNIRLSADLGLTDDSTDAFVTLSWREEF